MVDSDIRGIAARMNTEVCDQCGKCPSACPVTVRVAGFNPRQIIARFALGRDEELESGDAIWTCTSCLKCRERCPEEISPYDVILTLRREAISNGRPHPFSFDDQVKAVLETGAVSKPQQVRTRSRERRDRASVGLPPATRPKDMTRFAKVLDEILKERES